MRTARVHHAARRRGGAWPLAARAQQRERMRRIGVLMRLAADDPEAQARIAAFLQGLQQLGWTDGRNVRIDYPLGRGRCRSRCTNTRRNWSRSRRTSSWPWRRDRGAVAAGDPHRADRVRAWSSIRSAPASSRAWRGRAATPPASRVRIRHEREMAGAAQGDRAGRDASRRSFGIRRSPPGSASSAQSRPWRRRSGWR